MASLGGHSFGNLFLAALTEVTGDFTEAIKSRQNPREQGSHLPGDDQRRPTRSRTRRRFGRARRNADLGFQTPIRRLRLEPEKCLPLPEALKAIRAADIITVGPGSLYTSILPNLLVSRWRV
jgi:uncharacterized cofD-like protein